MENKVLIIILIICLFSYYEYCYSQAFFIYEDALEYFNGTNGKEKSYEKAFFLFNKSAQMGCPDAQFMLFKCYSQGLGARQSDKKAMRWCKKAAKQGYAQAQHTLGFNFFFGIGCKSSTLKALKWYIKSANQGYQESIHNLQSIGAYPKIIFRFNDSFSLDSNDTSTAKRSSPPSSKSMRRNLLTNE